MGASFSGNGDWGVEGTGVGLRGIMECDPEAVLKGTAPRDTARRATWPGGQDDVGYYSLLPLARFPCLPRDKSFGYRDLSAYHCCHHAPGALELASRRRWVSRALRPKPAAGEGEVSQGTLGVHAFAGRAGTFARSAARHSRHHQSRENLTDAMP